MFSVNIVSSALNKTNTEISTASNVSWAGKKTKPINEI